MIRASCSGRRLAACCCVFLALSSLAAGASNQGNQADLDRLRDYLGAMQELRAEFSQQVIGPEEEIIEQASGSVVLSKPGRFRWDYREPYERIIVADGERIWFYEADLEQVTIRRMATGLGDTPAALLTGNESVLEHFNLLDSWTTDGIHWLQLAPLSAEADFSTVEIGFIDNPVFCRHLTGAIPNEQVEHLYSPAAWRTAGESESAVTVETLALESGLVDGLVVDLNRLGQRTRITLSGIDRSPRLVGDEFVFEIPAGVDVIDEDDM